jgi:predicted AAA+ superfamily ATPase
MITFFKRDIKPSIEDALRRGKSILLLGPRQTGKTTLIELFHADLNISFLQNKTRMEFEKNPDIIINYIHGIKKKNKNHIPLVVIDEVQKVPKVLDPIQQLIDKKIAKFIITGSSARKLMQQSEINLLPGRVISYKMTPLSYQENTDLSLDHHLYFGSLPEIALVKNRADKEEQLRSYVETYLEEEIRKEALLRKLPDFVKFLELSSIESGNIVNYSSIAQEIGVSHLTVKSYFDILETTLIGESIQPITNSLTRKKLLKSPKFLFFDLGVRRLAADEGLKLGKNREGQLFEQFVGLELRRNINIINSRIQLQFWNDPQAAEVDWVIRKNDKYIPIEVKYKSSPKKSDSTQLNKFLNEYNCPFGGYIVCDTEIPMNFGPQIKALSWKDIQAIVAKLKN